MHLLTFDLGGIRCALPAADVREVVRAVSILPLPNAPEAVEGVINVRGTLVPVLDLRRRLRLPAKPVALSDHLVLVRAGDREVAVRVDRAIAVVAAGAEQVEATGADIPTAPFVTAVGKLTDGLILVHDLRRFLDVSEQRSLEAAARRQRRA
jgi:purine-binding chemotaxis protein CheW